MSRLAVLLLLVLAGCESTPVDPANPYNVGLLFEHDGCKVYGWKHGYFARCDVPGEAMTSWVERHGKSYYHKQMPTSTVAVAPSNPAVENVAPEQRHECQCECPTSP